MTQRGNAAARVAARMAGYVTPSSARPPFDPVVPSCHLPLVTLGTILRTEKEMKIAHKQRKEWVGI
jgi:hypothetical protein